MSTVGGEPETRDKGEKQKHKREGEQLITDGVQRGLRPRPSSATFAKKSLKQFFKNVKMTDFC